MMTYEDFKQYLHLDNIDSNKHIAIVLSNPPCERDQFPDYLSENADNIQTFYFINKYSRFFAILNKDVVLKDTLVEYESVTDLPTEIVEPGINGDNP
jgi:hypothetical protein